MMVHHGDTETRSRLIYEDLTEQIISAAIEVHRTLGPGLLESSYEECLCHELHLRGLTFLRLLSEKLFSFSVPLCLRGGK